MSDLHNAILNLPCNPNMLDRSKAAAYKLGHHDACCAAYKLGFHDAQKAAAELVKGEEGKSTLASDVLAVCEQRGWSLHWTCRGAYLHLEASELIEALRGKRGDPKSEAADVLIVLMSITEHAGIPWRDVEAQAVATVAALRTKPRYAGEEFTKENAHV